MNRATKSRIEAIKNAASFLITSKIFSRNLSKTDIKNHIYLGELMKKHAKEVVHFLINKPNK